MRFGLIGTGPWASRAHGPGLLACPDADLIGVWGRDESKAAALAGRLGAKPYVDVDALLADVDAVAFAVPPAVQAGLATRAARAGRHVLLDKPIALDVASADALASAVQASGVASVVFFTDRFVDTSRAWFDCPEYARLARSLVQLVQHAAGAGQPVRRIGVAPGARGAVGHRAARPFHADRSARPGRRGHRGGR